MRFRTFNIHSKIKPILVLLLFLFASNAVFATQELGQFGSGAGTPAPSTSGGTGSSDLMFYSLVAAIVVELLAILILAFAVLRLIKVFYGISSKQLKAAGVEVEAEAKPKAKWFSFERLNKSVPIEREGDLLMDHDYDGIHELDNKMPPWFLWLFRVTIFFAIVYLGVYHIFKSSPLQLDEYKNELAVADKQLEAVRKNAANQIDENSVTVISDGAQIKAGETIFTSNCVACHGAKGEGGVGPNLTDDYWLHGGGVKHIFKTIKYGVPEKGMKAWEQDLSPSQIQEVASYILTLHGTNPPNAKEKQGELYKDEAAAKPADSVQSTAKTDSLKTTKM
ncbi:cbb3-type cytochrome c oxidase N-terminal domain-containing protein [Solitalea canadensis]|uniref:Cytochrome c, mono-and diheme variants family n=1 Tax=Solitalea canadensis (strain ATCC 29591 / DSM 3403 / JCM 21819 / LMG 8368 / NBRC 15130 / NCIMB 12057 / USAM 9D) TaxID=929556 RepID=H8KTM1_SOLCM|nr:cbb3-type cytochrome c oxidase N-terminal domain-containing protein [Solitalea canadensis]AFD06479.1 cytochrome c, mono- and diheme variants family [Solitalea canadensis DSM 3403]